MSDFWGLYELVAPGWSLREGYTSGPAAEGPFWLTAPTYEEVVWRTWCYLFGNYQTQDGNAYIWPSKPEGWRDRIAQARKVWDEGQKKGAEILQRGIVYDAVLRMASYIGKEPLGTICSVVEPLPDMMLVWDRTLREKGWKTSVDWIPGKWGVGIDVVASFEGRGIRVIHQPGFPPWIGEEERGDQEVWVHTPEGTKINAIVLIRNMRELSLQEARAIAEGTKPLYSKVSHAFYDRVGAYLSLADLEIKEHYV